MKHETASIRSMIKQQRRQLDNTSRQQYAMMMSERLKKHKYFRNSQHLAVYLPMHGEMNPLSLVDLARQSGKSIYLPVLMPFLTNRLWFARWHADSKMQTNRYGIPEPVYQGRDLIPATQLDLVITPLVAFDLQCHRIGMGGGYYDRSFSFLRFRQHWNKPRMVGIAYEFQKISRITPQTWDLPLQLVITEDKLYSPKP
jgi:5-formyltetrahydrofolate cyclo-ligase